MDKYFKLGKSATSFVCAKSGLTLANQNMAAVSSQAIAESATVREAIKNGHIIEVSEKEYQKWLKV